MGSGRSGTSMLGGILYQAGYFMGDKLYPPKKSNPKGFFEWAEINQINEQILSNYGKSLTSSLIKKLFKKNGVRNPGKNQRWLLSLSPNIDIIKPDPLIEERIKRVVQRQPFCYKDPRFSYTLPVWEPFLESDTAFVCVFREPDITVESILKECKTRDYLADLLINRKSAYKVWLNIYSHILTKNIDCFHRFFFIHYNQIYDASALPNLARFLDADLRRDFVDRNLKRTTADNQLPGNVKKLYKKLCERANYRPV
jgi:hypothetical protein